jgi:predicted Holliday junction resolvase-like endonuclease
MADDGTTLFLLFWALVATIVVFVLIRRNKRTTIDLSTKLEEKQSKTFQLAQSTMRGDINQILGTFSMLNDYEELMLLSTTSKQGSLDLLGIKEDMVHFIEVKSKGANLTTKERKLKKLVDAGRVQYIVKDAELPTDFKLEDRHTRSNNSNLTPQTTIQ